MIPPQEIEIIRYHDANRMKSPTVADRESHRLLEAYDKLMAEVNRLFTAFVQQNHDIEKLVSDALPDIFPVDPIYGIVKGDHMGETMVAVLCKEYEKLDNKATKWADEMVRKRDALVSVENWLDEYDANMKFGEWDGRAKLRQILDKSSKTNVRGMPVSEMLKDQELTPEGAKRLANILKEPTNPLINELNKRKDA